LFMGILSRLAVNIKIIDNKAKKWYPSIVGKVTPKINSDI